MSYAFRHERWALTQLGQFIGNRATEAKKQKREVDRMHTYLAGGELPFMHEGKRTFAKQILSNSMHILKRV